MLFLWFDHSLIEAWLEKLERQLAASRLTTSHGDALLPIQCLLEMPDRNHLGPRCVARVREQHR